MESKIMVFALFSLLLLSSSVLAAPNIVASNVKTGVSGNNIITTMTITNTGDHMLPISTGTTSGTWLIEMQVRPKGLLPLYVFPQNVCDITHPENVHIKFALATGMTENIALQSSNLPFGEYDVYLISRDKCHAAFPEGNKPVPPFPNFVFQGTFGIATGIQQPIITVPSSIPICGNLRCDIGENQLSCPTDCGSVGGVPVIVPGPAPVPLPIITQPVTCPPNPTSCSYGFDTSQQGSCIVYTCKPSPSVPPSPPTPPLGDLNVLYIFIIGSLLIGIAVVLLRR